MKLIRKFIIALIVIVSITACIKEVNIYYIINGSGIDTNLLKKKYPNNIETMDTIKKQNKYNVNNKEHK